MLRRRTVVSWYGEYPCVARNCLRHRGTVYREPSIGNGIEVLDTWTEALQNGEWKGAFRVPNTADLLVVLTESHGTRTGSKVRISARAVGTLRER